MTIRVVLLSGAGRSGGTIIGNVLGELPGVVSVGELYQIYNRNLLDTELCGCGKQLRQCWFWVPILREVFDQMSVEEFERMRMLRDNLIRSRNSLLMPINAYRQRVCDKLNDYMRIQERLYQIIHASTGASVIVDTSRIPSYGWLLTSMPSVSPYIIQLIRDPRAVAYSWQRRRSRPTADGVAEGIQQRPAMSALVWVVQNVATELLAAHLGRQRSIRISYETFTSNPRTALQHIAEAVDLVDRINPDIIEYGTNQINLKSHHTLAGNSSRFKTGQVRLSPDMDWKTRLPRYSKWIVTALCLPLLWRYGYRMNASNTT